VAGLLSAKNAAAAEHFLEDIAIADRGARKDDVLAVEDAFEAEVGHRGGHDAIGFELALGFEETRDG
jgi:hypothetical protein